MFVGVVHRVGKSIWCAHVAVVGQAASSNARIDRSVPLSATSCSTSRQGVANSDNERELHNSHFLPPVAGAHPILESPPGFFRHLVELNLQTRKPEQGPIE